MEQYVHTLIAADSAFSPKATQIAEFFNILFADFNFRTISDTRFQPGLRIRRPSGRFRSFSDPFTGETKSVPTSDQIKIESLAEVSPVIEGLEHYSVLASGEWKLENRPLVLLTMDGVPFEPNYLCEVGCHVRPESVSTSCWNEEAAPNDRKVPTFGEPCAVECKAGVFSHPWTAETIEVPNAGCARFWIEFEFGKFLLPEMTNTLAVLSPSIVAKTEECFQTRFVQGWRFN